MDEVKLKNTNEIRLRFKKDWIKGFRQYRIMGGGLVIWVLVIYCQARVQVQGLSKISNKKPGPGASTLRPTIYIMKLKLPTLDTVSGAKALKLA